MITLLGGISVFSTVGGIGVVLVRELDPAVDNDETALTVTIPVAEVTIEPQVNSHTISFKNLKPRLFTHMIVELS